MSLSSFVVSRSWASNPLRTALTVLGIAAGVAIVVAIYVMDHNTIQTRLRQQTQLGGLFDLAVSPVPARPVETVRQELAAHAGIQGVAVSRQFRVELAATERKEPLAGILSANTLPVLALGLEGALDGVYALARGTDLPANGSPDAVLLGAEAARLLGAEPGTKLQLREPKQGVAYDCRDGELVALPPATEPKEPFARTVTVQGVLTNDLLGRREGGLLVICTRSLAAELAPAAADEYLLRRSYGADIGQLRRDLSTQYAVGGAQLGEAPEERAFRNGLKVIGCLALVLGMYVVFQTLSHSLVSRIRLLGLLRCLGASRGDVSRIFLGDALLLGIVGSLTGLLLGIVLAWMLKAREISSLGGNKPWAGFELPIGPMLWTAALGVLFTLAGAAFPLWRARQMPAMWILRQRSIAGQGEEGDLLKGVNLWLFGLLVVVLPLAYLAMTPLFVEDSRETVVVLLQMAGMIGSVGGLLLLAPYALALAGRFVLAPLAQFWPLPAWLCRKTVERQAGRIAAGVVGLAAVLLAFLSLKSLTASLAGDVDVFSYSALVDRAFVEFPVRSAAATRDFAAIQGVTAVEPIEGEVIVGGETGQPFVLRGLDVAAAGSPVGALGGEPGLMHRYADTKDRTLVASSRLAMRMGWKCGTPVALRDRAQNRVYYEVLVVSDRSGYQPMEQAWAIASPHWLRKDWCVGGACVQYATLRTTPNPDFDAVNHGLRERVPELKRFKSGAYIHGYHLADVARDFYIFDLLMLMILCLAGVGLLNGMTIAAIGRAREIGVLQALGVGPRSLRLSLLFEGVVTGGLSAVLALLLGIPMAHLLVRGLNTVAQLAIPVVVPRTWMYAIPPIALVTGILAALIPALRAARTDPAESVRFE